MELISGIHNLRARHRGCVVTIGAFDGVHLGHQVVLNQLIRKAQAMGLPSVVIIFEPLPREYFAPYDSPARLMSFREKINAFTLMNIDRVLRIRFDDSLRGMDAAPFIQEVFVDGLGAKHIIVGDDLRFGHDRNGDIDLMAKMGKTNGFTVESADTFCIKGERVSSTRIRKALVNDDFQLAEELLGKPYSISGRVIYGRQLGRELGAPTANVALRRIRAPMAGVYAVEVKLRGALHQGVANVGNRPTVGSNFKAILEVHLLDFNDDIYGENIEVIFRKKMRDEVKFESIEALKVEIHKDFELGRQYFKHLESHPGSIT